MYWPPRYCKEYLQECYNYCNPPYTRIMVQHVMIEVKRELGKEKTSNKETKPREREIVESAVVFVCMGY